MDNLRIHEKNIASSEIKRIKNLLSKNKDTIDRLSNIDTDIEFNKKQIEKLKKCCKEFDEKLEILNKRYDDLSSNILDNELKEKILTADIDTIILFEQVKDSDIQKIHEYTNEYYTVYQKKRNERHNKIISKEKRTSLLTTEQWENLKCLANSA